MTFSNTCNVVFNVTTPMASMHLIQTNLTARQEMQIHLTKNSIHDMHLTISAYHNNKYNLKSTSTKI